MTGSAGSALRLPRRRCGKPDLAQVLQSATATNPERSMPSRRCSTVGKTGPIDRLSQRQQGTFARGRSAGSTPGSMDMHDERGKPGTVPAFRSNRLSLPRLSQRAVDGPRWLRGPRWLWGHTLISRISGHGGQILPSAEGTDTGTNTDSCSGSRPARERGQTIAEPGRF
jgi:hypothetical protein